MISYTPFWNTIKEKHISQYELIHKYNFNPGLLNSFRKNKSITLSTLHNVCNALNCDITDVVIFIDEDGDII